LFFVRLPELARTSTFRWTLAIAGAFVLSTLLLFGFVYWQTADYMTRTTDTLLTEDLARIAATSTKAQLDTIAARLRRDPRRVRVAALFDRDGRRIAGNIEGLPEKLVPDVLTDTMVVRIEGNERESQQVHLIARVLPSGETLVLGRNMDQINEFAEIVAHALLLGLIPAAALALAVGMVASLRARDRLSEVNQRIQRIVAGDLRERLPTRERSDPFDQLAAGVNRMLDEIGGLIQEIAGIGNDIAHDLRTPLTRVRVRLERGRDRAKTLDELRAVADQAISGLDQCMTVITALLRIAEIEHSRRLDGFSEVRLAPLLREVGDLYDPIAEDKHVTLAIEAKDEATVHGDRDLLFEAVANLVDNAVKFTPEGGHVDLALLRREHETVIRVKDTGCGINESEREAVTKRFYRSDKSRGTEGLGLGLSLVAAIVKLHGFRFAIGAGPGCTAEIACPQLH
jgi:signal transduction histidine kinase